MMAVRLVNGRLRLRSGMAALVAAGVAVAVPQGDPVQFNSSKTGQSNMANLTEEAGDCQYWVTNARARRWRNGALGYVGAGDPTGTTPLYRSYYGSPGWGSGVVNDHPDGDGISIWANELTAAITSNVVSFEYAVKGSAIQSWIDDGTSNNWTTFRDAVKASGLKLQSSLWLQGEQNMEMTVAQYKSYLRQVHLLHAGLSNLPIAQFHFGIILLGPVNGYGGMSEGAAAKIRQAQLEYVNENAGAFLAGIVTDLDLGGGDIHINSPSQRLAGARYAKVEAAVAKGVLTKWNGPRITGASRSGLAVTLAISGATGALKDGAGGTGNALVIFRFFDAGAGGAQIAYTSAIVNGAPVLTLASAPVGVLTMDCGMANAPIGANANPAGWLYDSSVIPRGDGRGLPLIPCAPITVTGS